MAVAASARIAAPWPYSPELYRAPGHEAVGCDRAACHPATRPPESIPGPARDSRLRLRANWIRALHSHRSRAVLPLLPRPGQDLNPAARVGCGEKKRKRRTHREEEPPSAETHKEPSAGHAASSA